MYYVICPICDARVEIPADVIGPDREDLFNVVECDCCSSGFDYDDDDVIDDTDQATT